MENLTPDLSVIIKIMKEQAGIVFTQDKSYVILAKVYPLIERYKLNNVDELIKELRKENNFYLLADLVNILTVNETSFYRDLYPFEAIAKYMVPSILKLYPNKKNIKILSAACSTGQEAYSVVMHFCEHKEYNLVPQVTAIDLSTTVLERARHGVYNQFEVQRGLPVTLLIKYFDQVEKNWVIKDQIKKHVSFKQFNLKNDISTLGEFDILFCRNVLIYFDEVLRKQVIANLVKAMGKGAFLILGSTESIPWGEYPELKQLENYSGIYYKQ